MDGCNNKLNAKKQLRNERARKRYALLSVQQKEKIHEKLHQAHSKRKMAKKKKILDLLFKLSRRRMVSISHAKGFV